MDESIKKGRNGIRHSANIKYTAKLLRRKGKTHREIAKELGISLGSADLWTKGIHITTAQKMAIEQRRTKPYSTEEQKEKLRQIIKIRFAPFYQKNRKHTKEKLLQKIRDFYKTHGRIPLKREFNLFAEYRRKFGSWNNGIRAAGFTPNEVIFSKKFIASDGHKCDSFAEKIIDDYLSDSKIRHERNVPYQGTKMTTDFLVKNIRIEYFGLAGVSSKYNKLIRKKRFWAEKNKCCLVEMYPPVLFASGFKKFFLKNLRRWLKNPGSLIKQNS